MKLQKVCINFPYNAILNNLNTYSYIFLPLRFVYVSLSIQLFVVCVVAMCWPYVVCHIQLAIIGQFVVSRAIWQTRPFGRKLYFNFVIFLEGCCIETNEQLTRLSAAKNIENVYVCVCVCVRVFVIVQVCHWTLRNSGDNIVGRFLLLL